MNFKNCIYAVFLTSLCFTLEAVADYKLLSISPDERLIHPYRELAYSPNDIKEVRRLAGSGVNSKFVKEVLASASQWMSYSDEHILSLLPDSNAIYAFGTAGDPKTNQPWPWYGREKDMCNVDRPGQVKSPHTGDIYGIQKPGEEYYDDGSGWVRPSDGKKFYFKGIWNSYVNVKLHEAIENLSIAYMLTGDPAIAHRALMILDHLATDRSKRPEIDGPCDYAYPMATPDKAFFSFVGNLANERTVYTGLAFDLIANTPYASAPSSVDPNVTVFYNIKKHYFSIYETWYFESKKYLQNHAIMMLANMTVQGTLFGREDYLRPAIEATYAFMDGTINRDGDYYELAGGYGNLGRDYGGVLIALLRRYNPSRYENAAELSKPSDYPYNLNLGNDPRWYAYCTDMIFRLSALGHSLQYGDSKCDRRVLLDKNYEWLSKRQTSSLLMINGMVSSPEHKKHIAELYWSMRPEDRETEPSTENILLYGLSMWQRPERVKTANADKGVPLETDLMPAKRICILRGGQGVNSRALFIRGGSNSSHSHDDQMALVPYGNGMVLAGEYGYGWSGTPDHTGYSTRAIAHNTATINRDLPASYTFKGRTENVTSPSSDITGYLPTGPAQFIEMNNPAMWKDAAKNRKEYRRTAWLIDIDAENYYFVDMFQIIGGYVHDYAWSAPYDDNESNDTFKIIGVNPQPQQGVWTLAAFEKKYRDVTWNKPGQSWGERIFGLTDGKVRDIGLNDAPKDQRTWNPPPGNGYGMIWDVKIDKTRNDWTAVWKLQDNKHYLRTDIFNFDGMEAITGRAPSLHIEKHHNVVICRRQDDKSISMPLHSRYANITQVGESNSFPLKNVERLAVQTSDQNNVIALSAAMTDGTKDYILASRVKGIVRSGKINMDARRGFARVDANGQLIHLAMQEGRLMEAGGWKVQAENEKFEARIVNVKAGWNENKLTIDKVLPAGCILGGSMILISGSSEDKIPYTHNEYYYVEKIEPTDSNKCTLVFEKQSLIATRLRVDSVDIKSNIVSSAWPNEMATWPGTFELNGKMLVVQDKPEQATIIRSYLSREVKVLDANGFRKGDYLDVYVAKPQDVLTMPTTVTLTRQENGHYLLRTNTKVSLTTAAAVGIKLMAQVGNELPQILAVADENNNLEAVIVPEKFKSGKIQLWTQK